MTYERPRRPIAVLTVDDSVVVREFVRQRLGATPDITVVGTAGDGEEGLAQARALRPDVVVLDVAMPHLDGLDMLATLMAEQPMPVVMLSMYTEPGAEATVRALALGAVDFITKPRPGVPGERARMGAELVAKVRAAAAARLRPSGRLAPSLPGHPAAPPPVQRPRLGAPARGDRLVVIGCSTGGPRALYTVLPALPADLAAGVVVVQHLPVGYTEALAARLDAEAALPVREAVAGEPVRPGEVLIAPSGRHLVFSRNRTVRFDEGPRRHGVCPSVDVTLESAAERFGARVLAVILTGMGADGARGAAAVHAAGGAVIAEDVSTCVVYGMPRAVVEQDIDARVLPLERVAEEIEAWTRSALRRPA